MLPYNAHKNSQGFTLFETLTVVIIIGILSAIAAPSFLGMLNRNKVNDALNQVKGALQEAQREAMRTSKPCTVALNSTTKKVSGSCLVTGERALDSKVGIELNETSIQFSHRGTIPLIDAGTVVLFSQDNPSDKQCLVISSPLGVIRTGKYTGSIPSTTADPIAYDKCKKNGSS